MKGSARYALLDALRGFSILSMICYHTTYDLVAIYGLALPWYFDTPGYLWQQSICWSFILLSGVSWHFGHNPLKKGLVVSACGLIISLITAIFMPSQLIVMGVLSFLGAAALLMIPVSHLLRDVDPRLAATVSAVLFFVTRNTGHGSLGFEGLNLMGLPDYLYIIPGGFILGFPSAGFSSSDYFPIVPWFFLFAFGDFLWCCIETNSHVRLALRFDLPPLSILGRGSLIIYLLHQPLIMLVLTMVMHR
ncbi:MAG TPA: heparan-alpha-glucosaminide N-acetyltransferase domain-containing protein [Clostridia bacterium]|nr:heparan-alpha-glucosaminide N-acetyltransferase domain-containing protein [Clostridia bacterium]